MKKDKRMPDITKMPNAAFLSRIINSCPVAIFVIDLGHTVVYWNKACEMVTGWSAEKVLGTCDAWKPFYDQKRPVMADLIVAGTMDRVEELYAGKCHPSPVLSGAWEAEDFFPQFPDGGKWLAFTAVGLYDDAGVLIGAIETLRDITAEKNAETAWQESRHLLSEIVDGCPVPMFVLDQDHRIAHWNRACESLNGMLASDLIGSHDQWKTFYGEKRPVLADLILDSADGRIPELYQGICKRSPHSAGAWEATDHFPEFTSGPKWLYFTAAPLRGLDGRIVGAVETLQDVTERKNYELELAFRANHDPLTGLANRNLLDSLLEHSIAQAKRNDTLLAVLFLDLDNFKQVNDTLGHGAGDEAIQAMGQRILSSVRDVDTVARIGGDEYVVVLHEPVSESYITDVVYRILAAIGEKLNIQGHTLYLGCSVGIALFPKDGQSPAELMMHADTAMYRAKEKQKGGFCYFTSDMNERARLWLELKHDLHGAETKNELELYYQPQYSLSEDRIVGAEALIRWNHPEMGILNPALFIPIAEESGLILPIGAWVVREAVQQACRWKEETGLDIRLSVNISARQFGYADLLYMLEQAVANYNFHPFYLELELTESMVMENPRYASELLHNMKEKGFSLAMDDFGTGYSSLAYLRRFPFDMIKIDKSFIDDLGRSRETEAIVSTMLDLGRALGMSMVAEGVETLEQLRFLREKKCGEIQGFVYSQPLTAGDFLNFLRDPPKLPT